MSKLDEKSIAILIAKALKIESNLISINSSAENVEEWDSLGHLSILQALDQHFDGKVANLKELASTNSVKDILSLLKKNSLL
tara:strand:- start:536 stop:781 length:246 start_codon:yes stop_codon:yes gene_type:complete